MSALFSAVTHRYNFHLKDEGDQYVLEVECPKYMDTSLIECDMQTTYVRLHIKTKVIAPTFPNMPVRSTLYIKAQL